MRQLAEVLDDIAGQAKLYDVTNVAIRGARRRRRVRALGRSAVAAVVVAVVIGAASMVMQVGGAGHPEGGPGRQDGDPPALVRPLLDTPARGSLAGDAAFLDALLDRVSGDPDHFGLPGDRGRLRVLFAGDLPGKRRLAIVAGVTAAARMIELTGPGGASAKRLDLTGWSDVTEPVVRDEWRGGRGNAGYILLFGPAGYAVSVSTSPRYLADGSIERTWQPEPAGYVARDTATLPSGLRVRMSRDDNTVLFEGAVAAPGARRVGAVDPAPLHQRGSPAPRAADAAADALAYSSGLVGPDVHYVVLWSDEFPVEDPGGGGSGTGQIATVMAVTPDGGGPYITVATDTNEPPNARNHPTGAGVSGDPERALIVMRLPYFSGTEPDTLQIVGPPAAVRVELLKGDAIVGSAPLANGVGRLHLAGPVELMARAYDAQGAVVAQRSFADVTGSVPSGGYEPEFKGW